MNLGATGLDPVEEAVLSSFRRAGSTSDGVPRKTSLVLDDVNDAHGFAHDDVHARILGLCRPWLTGLRLIDFHGNVGARSFAAADPQYTEVRLTELGNVCAGAVDGLGPGLPIGLVFGDLYKGGRRPPLDPSGLVQGLRAIEDGMADAAVLELVGPPSMSTRRPSRSGGCGGSTTSSSVSTRCRWRSS